MKKQTEALQNQFKRENSSSGLIKNRITRLTRQESSKSNFSGAGNSLQIIVAKNLHKIASLAQMK